MYWPSEMKGKMSSEKQISAVLTLLPPNSKASLESVRVWGPVEDKVISGDSHRAVAPLEDCVKRGLDLISPPGYLESTVC